jgi:hypothetical protein
MRFARFQCAQLNHQSPFDQLASTELIDSKEMILTHYSRISKIRLQNRGGHQVTSCEAYRLPAGLSVTVSADGHTCEISGVPVHPQARTDAYVVASNFKGSSLSIVPISINALTLRE